MYVLLHIMSILVIYLNLASYLHLNQVVGLALLEM